MEPLVDPGLPADSVIVVNPATWARRPLELGQLRAAWAGWRSRDRVIPDSSGRPPETTLELADPSYWSRHAAELADALGGMNPPPAGAAPSGGAGAVPVAPRRLTWTVDEAATALGISRAFGVRRGPTRRDPSDQDRAADPGAEVRAHPTC
jgi:hypothetical protein